MNINKRGFTLVELLAVMVILAIILAIAVPTISGILEESRKSSFESDAKMVLKGIDYKKLEKEDYDETSLTIDNIKPDLGLSNANYSSISVSNEDNIKSITIIGKEKWAGLIACGTFYNIKVVDNISDCGGDSLPPAITILGDNPASINQGENYNDAGATAMDNKDGDITSKITVESNVNPNISGTYTVTYTVKDNADNESTVARTINVIDNVGPTVVFYPRESSRYLQQSYSATVTVSDNSGVDGASLKYLWGIGDTEPPFDSFSLTFTNGSSISTPVGVSGQYYLWIVAKDNLNNVSIIKRSAPFYPDNEKPVISLTGTDPLVMNATDTCNSFSLYSNGISASDNINIKTFDYSGTINLRIAGKYKITYTAEDSAGNQATPVERNINVNTHEKCFYIYNEIINGEPSQYASINGYDGEQSYTLSNTTNSCEYYCSGDLRIPSQYHSIEYTREFINDQGTYAEINSIADGAFMYSYFDSVELPDTIISIGNEAFRESGYITYLKLSNNLRTIGNYAFKGSLSLSELYIPATVTNIGTGALQAPGGEFSWIDKIIIASSNISIGDYLINDMDNNFRTAYLANGAGTYIYDIDTNTWTKQ